MNKTLAQRIAHLYRLIYNQERQLSYMDVMEGVMIQRKSGLKPMRVRFKKWHTSKVRNRVKAAVRLIVFQG